MSDLQNGEGVLSAAEVLEERIELLAQRELHCALAACLFTALVLLFAAESPEALRLTLTALAGGFFFTAGYARLRRNFAIARR